MDVLLCGDIGGTHTRLALVQPGRPDVPVASATYSSTESASFTPILTRFLAGQKHIRLRGAAFGIPGPVSEASKELWMVNLPWRIRVADVARALKLPRVRFLNDFVAVAQAVPYLKRKHLHAIGGGAAQKHGPIAVIGAGTGLGEGVLVWDGTRYLPIASEGGHADFAPRTDLEVRLLNYLRGRFGPVAWERVVSGPGLVNLAEFLRDQEGMSVPGELAAALSSADAQTAAPALITTLGQSGTPDPLCQKAIELFCTLYGAEAGNLALRAVATGGVYIGGGIAQHVLGPLESGGFRAAFEAKQGFARLLRDIPTWVITHPNPGLLGAAIAAQWDALPVRKLAATRARRGHAQRKPAPAPKRAKRRPGKVKA